MVGMKPNRNCWTTCFIAGLSLVLLLAATSAYAADTDYKINRELMAALTDDADAVAPFFVVFSERADTKPARRITDRIARAQYVANALQAVANRSQAGARAYLSGRRVDFKPFWIENRIYIKQGTLELAREMARRPEVAAVIPERIHPVPQPKVESGTQALEWNISQINADEVWSSFGDRGEGIIVANIDTGVQFNHPALYRQYLGWNGSTYNHTGKWYDPSNTCGAAGTPPCDNNGHGTHTMGTMVGETSDLVNQIGVAPGAKWIACKGCESNSCSDASLTACAQWVLAPTGGVPPHIVNNSWGGGSGDTWYQSYVQSWRSAGIFPAFSIGNSGPTCNTAGSPGDYPESFASGGTAAGDAVYNSSSRGPSALGGIKPDVAAPGQSVRSSVPTDSYSVFSGTSMASPHTAATVALIWSEVGTLTGNIAETENIIASTTQKLYINQTCGGVDGNTVSPNNTFGAGRIDALAAVTEAVGGPVNQPPVVTITSPANGSSFNCGSAVDFAGTATDTEDGTITASLLWAEGSTQFGTGGTAQKTFSCSELGNHTITAQVTDSGGLPDTDTITISITDPDVIIAPSNLSALVNAQNVTLNWTDNSSNETGFRIERKERTGIRSWAWVSKGTVAAGVTTFTHNAGRGIWSYRVIAYNATKESAPSNVVSVRVR